MRPTTTSRIEASIEILDRCPASAGIMSNNCLILARLLLFLHLRLFCTGFCFDSSSATTCLLFLIWIDDRARGYGLHSKKYCTCYPTRSPWSILRLLWVDDDDDDDELMMRLWLRMLQAINSYRRGSKSTEVYLSQVVEIMKKLDTDRNGVLSREEFVRGCANDPDIAKLLLGGIKPWHSLIEWLTACRYVPTRPHEPPLTPRWWSAPAPYPIYGPFCPFSYPG